MLKKVLLFVSAGLVTLVVAFVLLVQLRKNRTFEAPYPDLHATEDPVLIERGRYLAYGPGHCVDCHYDPADRKAHDAGQPVALSGGLAWKLPPGNFYSKNLTPDVETGIGKYTDAELARVLRYGVKPDGRVSLPFMRFADMTDEDLTAILSFLRSQKPVKHAVPEAEPTFLGDVILSFVLEPVGPTRPTVEKNERGPTVEYGRYLASDVGGCVTCHTKLDLRTGQFTAPLFSGGTELPSEANPNQIFTTPNLTPHPTDGWLNGWTEDAFVQRFGAGPVHEGTPMPWRAYSKMSEDDRRALYRFFRSLPPSPGGPDTKTRQVLADVNAP